MKKNLQLALLLFMIQFNLYSQIDFNSGYLINESDQKIKCFIKNKDQRSNPTEFEYKISVDDSIHKAYIKDIKEFGIDGISKFIRANVNIDRSSDDVNNMNTEKNPTFHEEKLFLKVLVEGKASLYNYENGTLSRFFYKMNDSTINQLVYKRYLTPNQNIAKNNFFRQQLYIDMCYQGINMKDVENLKYYKKDLINFFVKYNEITKAGYINYELKPKKYLFHLSLNPGMNISSLTIHNAMNNSVDIVFGTQTNVRFGIEGEFIIPYYRNKWSLFTEPTYQYFNEEKTVNVTNVSGGILVSKVKYHSIELPVGIRHYFYLNDKSKIFINLSYIIDFSRNSSVVFTRNDGSVISSLDINARNNMGLGAGYKYNNKYSIEMRYQNNREILGDYLFIHSEYSTFSIVFGYVFF